MSFIAHLQRAREILQQQGRLSVRAIARELDVGGEELDELVEELVDVQQVARRDGKALVWTGPSAPTPTAARPISPAVPTNNLTTNNLFPGAYRSSDPTGARKVVTIVFADLARSTALHERLDPESVRGLMETYYRAMRRAVEENGGTVVKLLGDGVMAAFGVPRVAEDDAIRAVRAGIAMVAEVKGLGVTGFGVGQDDRPLTPNPQPLNPLSAALLSLRVGINTGEVVVSADNTDVVGDPVNVAARLQAEANDGEVVIGEPTRRLVESLVTLAPLGRVALKGRTEAMKAYRVESLERPVAATKAEFVGRDAELAHITAAYDDAVAGPATRLAVLLGSPGLGKSRLIEEFTRRLGDAAGVIAAHCDVEGGATFAPVAEALREFLSTDDGRRHPRLAEDGGSGASLRSALEAVLPSSDTERTRILNGITSLLAGSPASPEETFFVIRRFLAALAATRPVVLVIDDLHWAEPLLLDLVEHLVQWGSQVPLLILIGARPELRESRSSLATPGGFVTNVVMLGGLDAGAAMRLAANVVGAADLPAAVAAKVLATSEGNPLFVAELVRMLVQEGALKREGERWTTGAGLADLEMPPTIHALLAARIERLRPDERSVLERAAVIGRSFSRNAVAALLPAAAGNLDACLEALRRSELIEPDSGWFLGEPVLRFHHILIRDAAYRRLLKGTRAELHERLADWIESRAPESVEHDETLGWHLEQSHQLLGELGPIDARGRLLGERAARHLAAAGRRALGRDDLPVAADLLGRAFERLDGEDPARAELALDWCEALLAAGEVGPAAKAIDELARFIQPTTNNRTTNVLSSRLCAWHTCFKGQLTALTAPQELQATVAAVAGAAEALAKLGDAAGEAKAHSVHAQALARLGKVGACEAALDKALAAARRAGDRRRANAVLAGAPLAALWGPSPVTRASGRCLDVVRVLRITQGAPAVESVALSCQGVLEALRGRTDPARRMLASSRKMVEELGIAHRLFEADVFAGRIEAMDGDAAAAEGLLREAYDGLRHLGLGIDAARAAALLARALLAQDRVAEAEAVSHESEALAGDDLQAAIAWRGVRAEALAKRGEHAAAVELAKAAVALASATDALLDHADARMALATALRAAGRAAEADAEEGRAIELWESKGATMLAERARRNRQGAAPAVRAAPRATAPATVRRRVSPNAATAMQTRFDAAIAARDFDAIAAQFREDHQEIDHPSGSTYGRDACIASLQRLFRSRDPHYAVERLATLGDQLLLVRRSSSASGAANARYDVGAYENEALQLFEVDERGLCGRAEVFGADHLGEALARLFECHADLLPGGPERERAKAAARSFGVVLTSPADVDGYSRVIAPDFESVDHRHLSTWSMRGGGAFLAHNRALREVAADVVIVAHDVLALAPDAMLLKRMHSGTERLGGGAYERSFLVLFGTDAAGRLSSAEWFDDDRGAEAQARFDALVLSPVEGIDGDGKDETSTEPFANAAARADAALFRCFNARDWAGVEALAGPGLVFDERRRMVRNTCDRKVWLEQFRVLFDVPKSRFTSSLRATRGDRLSLNLHRFEGEVAEGGGPLAMDDHLVLHEVDAEGRIVAIVLFDLEDEGAAYAELDRRYEAGEAVAHLPCWESMRRFVVAVASHDWDAVAALCAESMIERDHRGLAVIGTTRGAQAWAENFRTLAELSPDTTYRVDHFRVGPRGYYSHGGWHGTREGGSYEIPVNAVIELDERGRIVRADIYDDAGVAAALARFAELGAVTASSDGSFANAATATVEPLIACMVTHDWEGFERLLAPEFRMSDRRRVVQLELGRDEYVAFTREVADGRTLRGDSQALATRGDRLALNRSTFQFTDDDVGPSEIAFLILTQVDERGRIVAYVRWDLEDIESAYADLEARWEAGEGAAHRLALRWLTDYRRFFAARDWTSMAAILAPDLVSQSHRLVSWGTLHGPAGLVSTLQAQMDLAPDTRLRADHVRTCAGGVLTESVWCGTRDGGVFENVLVAAVEIDALGRAGRVDVWEVGQIEHARARFEAIAAKLPGAASCTGRTA